MKLIILLFAALIATSFAAPAVIATSFDKLPAPAKPSGTPPGRCFVKKYQCCFKFAACGTVTRKIASPPKRCDYRKCRKQCRPVCGRVCADRRVREKKRICRDIYRKVWYKYKSQTGLWLWAYRWAPAGKRCRTFNVWVVKHECKNQCKDACYRICFTVRATCTKVRTIQFPKFCASLDCGEPMFVGNTKKPADVVGRNGKVIKVRTVRDGGKKSH